MKRQNKLATAIIILLLIMAILLLPINKKVRVLLMCDYPTYFSMVIAALTLIATIAVAYLIYVDQQHRAKEQYNDEINKAKTLICSEIENAIQYLILPCEEYKSNFVGKNIRDLFTHNSSILNTNLGKESFNHLSMIVNFIDAYANSDNEMDRGDLEFDGFPLLFRGWINNLLHSKYREYAVLSYDYKEMLSKNTFELLVLLQYSELKYDNTLTQVYSELSGNVFSFNPPKREYTVMDGDELIMHGTLLLDSFASQYRIKDGYDKDNQYAGYYSDGLYEGEGCSFNGRSLKSMEGEWKHGLLYTGNKYDNLFLKIRISDDADCGNVYDVLDNLEAINPLVNSSNVTSFYVADLVIDKGNMIEKYNERTLLDFINNEYREAVWSIGHGPS